MTMLCTLIRGQMSYTFFQLGAHVLLCQLLGGQMSSYAIFHRGAHVRGENVLHSLAHLPLLTSMTPTIFSSAFCADALQM